MRSAAATCVNGRAVVPHVKVPAKGGWCLSWEVPAKQGRSVVLDVCG